MLYLYVSFQTATVRSQRGAGMAEYALLLILIAIVCIVGFGILGNSLNDRMTTVASQIKAL